MYTESFKITPVLNLACCMLHCNCMVLCAEAVCVLLHRFALLSGRWYLMCSCCGRRHSIFTVDALLFLLSSSYSSLPSTFAPTAPPWKQAWSTCDCNAMCSMASIRARVFLFRNLKTEPSKHPRLWEALRRLAANALTASGQRDANNQAAVVKVWNRTSDLES